MWILQWLPDWFFYGLLLVGLIGYVTTYLLSFIPIPLIFIYKTPIQIISIILVIIGTFMTGAIHNEAKWVAKVKEMEIKVAEAEQKSQKTNKVIVTKFIKKKEYYREKGEDIITYVDREIVKYDDQCKIPKEFVDALNKAAEK
jgi:hypothetical protein